jgi:hypothetical protein
MPRLSTFALGVVAASTFVASVVFAPAPLVANAASVAATALASRAAVASAEAGARPEVKPAPAAPTPAPSYVHADPDKVIEAYRELARRAHDFLERHGIGPEDLLAKTSRPAPTKGLVGTTEDALKAQ